jgi:hypothetical protein
VGYTIGFIGLGLRLEEFLLRGATKLADPAPHPNSNSDTGMGPGREYPGIPRWVKAFGIIAIVLVLLVAIIIFILGHTSPVQHGP